MVADQPGALQHLQVLAHRRPADGHALGEHPERDGLAILDVEGFPLKQPWSVVHLRNKVLSLPAQAFLDELLNSEPATSGPLPE